MIQRHVCYVLDDGECRRCQAELFTQLLRLSTHILVNMLSWCTRESSPAASLALELEIDNKRTFTTLERFTGKLTIRAQVDTSFDKLDIKLVGISRTFGRRVVPQAPSARTVTTAHRFLELTQPDALFGFPEHRRFRAGRVYELPFEFAIPDRMLPSTCRHAVASPCVHRLHTSMPPSFGDNEVGEATDYAPRHTSIKYRVVASVESTESATNCQIASCSEGICFKPSSEAFAPFVGAWEPALRLGKEMSLKKLWTRSSGNLIVTSIQASPFLIKDVNSVVWRSELSGSIKIKLKFYPAYDGAEPPKQIDLSSILRTKTTSAVSPLPQLPSEDPWQGPEVDQHTAPSVILSPQAIGGIEWIQDPEKVDQNDEECPSYEAASSGESSRNGSLRHCYSAQIMASFDAAIGFSLVRTFHSCLISRAYEVELKLSVSGSANIFSPAMRLTHPVRIVPEEAATRRDSVVIQEGNSVSGLGWDWSYDGPKVIDSEDPPPGYAASNA